MGSKNNPGAFDCYAAAEPDEPMFVLLARDRQASRVVRQWANLREDALRESDATCTAAEVMAEIDQIAEARKCAEDMDAYREQRLQRQISDKRMGAMLTCGCWWAEPPGAVERGYACRCPLHGDVNIREVNVRLMSHDDMVSEFINDVWRA